MADGPVLYPALDSVNLRVLATFLDTTPGLWIADETAARWVELVRRCATRLEEMEPRPTDEPTEADPLTRKDTDALARPRLRQTPTRDATSAAPAGAGPSAAATRADLTDDPVGVAAEAIRLHSNGSAHSSASVAVAALRTAGLVGGRSAAPTRGEVWQAIAMARDPAGTTNVLNALGEPGIDWATDAVMVLLSRSAAEPEEAGDG